MAIEDKNRGAAHHQAEHITPKFRIIDLGWGLKDIEQERALREAVLRQGRIIDCLVHPYYPETDDIRGDLYPSSPKYIQERDAFIQSAIVTETPLVIFKSARESGELEARTAYIQSGLLYVVSGAEPGLLETMAAYLVGDIFQKVGVTHVRIGGRILMYADDPYSLKELQDLRRFGKGKPNARVWLAQERLPYGCPMWAATGFLKSGFDVSFSPIVSPAVLDHP